MEEGKYKRRLMTLSPVDIAGWEDWLSAMAEKGLFIAKFGMWFAHFRMGEPKKTAYRLEPCEYGEDAPKPLQQEMYQEFGWEFVGILRDSFFVFANEEESPVEIHTDPVAQSFTL